MFVTVSALTPTILMRVSFIDILGDQWNIIPSAAEFPLAIWVLEPWWLGSYNFREMQKVQRANRGISGTQPPSEKIECIIELQTQYYPTCDDPYPTPR